MVNKPADEDTGKEAHNGQEYLTCDEVEQIEQRLVKIDKSLVTSQRQRAESTNDGRRDCDQQGCTLASGVQFLFKECRRHLMQGDERCQGSQ